MTTKQNRWIVVSVSRGWSVQNTDAPTQRSFVGPATGKGTNYYDKAVVLAATLNARAATLHPCEAEVPRISAGGRKSTRLVPGYIIETPTGDRLEWMPRKVAQKFCNHRGWNTTVKPEPPPAEAPAPALKTYSVLLLYPDYIASQYGETYYTHVKAISPAEAVSAAINEAMASNGWDDDEDRRPEDFLVKLVLEGECPSLDPQEGAEG